MGNGVNLTTIALPLQDIGRHIARTAGALVRGCAVEKQIALPCTLMEGNSVQDLR
jgi:DNA-binding LacI/PurR family transcriptional regulator